MNYRWTYRDCEQLHKQRRTVRNILYIVVIVAALVVTAVKIEQASAAYVERVAVVNGN